MNSPLLPDSAPFSAEQRHWLNGFLAGLVNASAGKGLPAGSGGATVATPEAPRARVLILYGSQSGNAEGLAHALADQLKTGNGATAAFAPAVHGMEAFREIDWSSENRLLLITSTWGDGDMPDNAAAFWDWLQSAQAPALPHAAFAVLGLGDRNYARFCQAGKNLDRRFAELGAKRVLPLRECDTDFEAAAAAWMSEAGAALDGGAAEAPPRPATTGTAEPGVAGSQPEPGPNGQTEGKANGAAHPLPGIGGAAPPAPVYGRKNPFPAPLIENHPLNAKGSSKDTRHISLSLLGSGLEYKPGDALGIVPRNAYELVDRIIIALNCLGNEKVGVEGQDPIVLRAALLSLLDLSRATPRLLANLGQDARNPSEKRRLADLLSGGEDNARAYLGDKDVLDVLEDFPHTRLEAQRLVEALGKLGPRLYSIASSPRENPGEVHLTVGIVRYRPDPERRIRRGAASTYLAERVPLGMPVRVFVQPTAHFRLPAAPGTPIIMVGPGTGIAPFRAFLQERRVLGDPGRNWLFFGDQRRQYDFLYGEEFVAWRESGFLTRLDLAFSRDQEKKIYVQDRMLENSRELFAWLQEGAHFYVCGDAKRMAKDVETALLQVISQESGQGMEGAKAYLDGLKSQRRYLRDVY